MTRLSNTLLTAAALLVAQTLAGVPAGAQEGPQLLQPGISGRTVCTQQYDPVCARRGNRLRTFGNACEAQRARYRIEYRGECRRGGPGWGWEWPGDRDRPQFCTREYAPVCAAGREGRRTFSNACEAEVAGYRIIRPGQC